eukprot:TRINITY_DN5019_c0_g1_i1.p2 TRINITY_DN5019_c0_g1~~TRINITY_DN5019_c0_g1_i1.p2  ORF type:complete len:177 (+),score=13.15 TRINITY_DN5019_c0_g1_i1:60-533(+)
MLSTKMRNMRITPALQPFRPAAPKKASPVCHARVANVEIPNSKCIRYSLQYVYGIGDTTACEIVKSIGLDPTRRTYDLNEDELAQIREEIDKYTVEGDLRRLVNMNIKRLKEIQCYRGRRHYSNLPTRGQNTKNNARTRKGKKKMAITGKKQAILHS